VSLSSDQRVALESFIGLGEYDGSVACRARMVLLRDDGYSPVEIARLAGVSKPTVYLWLSRYDEAGPDGLVNRVSSGRPPEVSDRTRARIVALTRQSPPAGSGLSHWSSRQMAKYLRRVEGIEVSHAFIAELWRDNDLQPHREGTFKLSADPDFETKVIDVLGLYLDPPQGALVVSVDEKTQVQALDRTQPMLPLDFGKTAKRTHDYVRHGTTNLFAALDTSTGQVLGSCFPRRRTKEFLTFMDGVVAAYPGRELHVVLDNLSTHTGPDIDVWLGAHPNVTFHFTPTGSSWMNQVEIWFGIITRQAIRRGTFTSVRDLITTINDYIAHWNQDAQPFVWTATPGEVIAKVRLLHRDFKQLLANNL
jgi:transposase